jgi:hypothetical protein
MQIKKLIFSLLNLLLFLAVFLGIYYWIWSSSTEKAKQNIESMLSKTEYSSVKVSGFPLQKTITINDLSLYTKKDYINDQKVVFKKIIISSLIFSKKTNIDLGKTISYKNGKDTEIGQLIFNSPPEISASFHKDGSIASFNYSDVGYKVLNETNTTISSAGSSEFKIKSIQSKSKTDYEFISNMTDLQNISILDKEDVIQGPNVIPEKNNVVTDIIFSKAHPTNTEFKDLLQINTLSLENKKYKIFIEGSMERSKKDILPYGKITVRIKNFENFINPIVDTMLVSINKKYRDKTFLQDLSVAEKEAAKRKERERIKNIPNNLNTLANANEDTSADLKVFVVGRNRDNGSFYVNNKSVTELIEMFKTTKGTSD